MLFSLAATEADGLFTITIRLRFDCDQGIDMSILCSVGVVANHSAVGGALSVTYDDVFITALFIMKKNVKKCN